MSYLVAKNLRASMSGVPINVRGRGSLGLSLSDLTGAVNTVKPLTANASGTLAQAGGVLNSITSLVSSFTGGGGGGGKPQTQFAPQPKAGLSTAAKVGIGIGAAGGVFLLVKALRK